MEKIKHKINIDKHGTQKERPPESISGPDIFIEKWNLSPFNNPEFLEQISDENEAIEKDYEYSEDELGEMQKLTEKGTNNIHLLEMAVSQNHSENIRESALKIILQLGRIAEKADSDALVLLIKIISRNSDQIIQAMDGGPSLQKQARIFLLGIANKNHDKTLEVLSALKNYLKNITNNEGLDSTDIKIMDWICSVENNRDTENDYLQTLYENFLKRPRDFITILSCINASNEFIQGMGIRQVFEIIKEYGFNEEETGTLINKWLFGGGSTKYMPEAFSKNIESIKSIEEKRPGIVKFLISKFGIYNFGRYPEDLLTKQFDEFENQDLPYGVVAFSEDDHNAVYFEYKDELSGMAKDLNGKYAIRIAEVGGKKDLMRLLVRLRLKYGKNHKISFGILGAHGNERAITLGNINNTGDREIYTRNVIKYGNRKYNLFEENATLILLSCMSGQKEGIGSKISKTMGVTTIAPKESSGLESIKPILESGDLKFKVKYSHHVKAATFRPRRKTKKQEFI